MPIRAQCPAGHAMMVPDHRAGTMLRCPRCGVELLVPGTPVARPVVKSKPPSPGASGVSLAGVHFVPTKDSAILKHPPRPPVVPKQISPPPPRVENVAGQVESEKADRKEAIVPPHVIHPEPDAPPIGGVEKVLEPPKIAVPEPPPPVLVPRRPPWIPDAGKRAAVFHLALLVGALAIFSAAPAAWEWFVLWQDPEVPPTPPWVFAMLFAAVLQLGYAVYLAYSPDWSALWTTTIALLLSAAAWAALLGTTLMGRDESSLVLLFQFADKLEGNRAALWCGAMVSFDSVMAYFLGLNAARWYHSYRLLKQVQES